jgi:hypothetical protein
MLPTLLRPACLVLLAMAMSAEEAKPMRVIDGAPIGGPPRVAAAVDLAFRELQVFCEAGAPEDTHVGLLTAVGADGSIAWADAFQLRYGTRRAVLFVLAGLSAEGIPRQGHLLHWRRRGGAWDRPASVRATIAWDNTSGAWVRLRSEAEAAFGPMSIAGGSIAAMRPKPFEGGHGFIQRGGKTEVIEAPWGWMTWPDGDATVIRGLSAISTDLVATTASVLDDGQAIGLSVFCALGPSTRTPAPGSPAPETFTWAATATGLQIAGGVNYQGSATGISQAQITTLQVDAEGSVAWRRSQAKREGAGWTVAPSETERWRRPGPVRWTP